jgi:hypothetical protein
LTQISKEVHGTYTNYFNKGEPHRLIVSVNNEHFIPNINGACVDTVGWDEIEILMKHAYDDWHGKREG